MYANSIVVITTNLIQKTMICLSLPNDFFLPGTQPHQLVEDIASPTLCDTCHTEPIFDRWRGSMMSQAGRDPLMWAALAIANNDAGNAGEYCLRCHTPQGWLGGRSHPANGLALQTDDLANGVSCGLCRCVS